MSTPRNRPTFNVRRVVTGRAPDGKSAVISDTAVAPLTARAVPGYAWHRIWSLDAVGAVPGDGLPQPARDHFPPPDGVRFTVFTVPPAGQKPEAALDPIEAWAELEEKFPGRARHMEREQVGLHTTATIDFIYVVAGEIALELDDGREVKLRAGDTVVQNGVRHAWRNHGDQPCVMVICMVGAERRSP